MRYFMFNRRVIIIDCNFYLFTVKKTENLKQQDDVCAVQEVDILCCANDVFLQLFLIF